MKKYEGMFVLHNKEAQKDHEYLEQHVCQLLEKVGAKLSRINKWDERQLAYEIKGQREGIFYLAFFEAEGPAIIELRRETDLSDLVLRLLVLRLDEIPDEEEVRKRSGRSPEPKESESTPASSDASSAPKTEEAKKDAPAGEPAKAEESKDDSKAEAPAAESSKAEASKDEPKAEASSVSGEES